MREMVLLVSTTTSVDRTFINPLAFGINEHEALQFVRQGENDFASVLHEGMLVERIRRELGTKRIPK